ncbi:MAG: ATP-binding cassette domain-containing protein [Clostridia bacterium]|nr:ATP-binding cassette domain-containing protein [Clostridia bacterium]
MLELKEVTKEFGNKKAVNEISFTVKNGNIYGIVGRNGAGKSTTFRMILKIIKPTSRRDFI